MKPVGKILPLIACAAVIAAPLCHFVPFSRFHRAHRENQAADEDLSYAAMFGDVPRAQADVAAGANVEARDDWGKTPLIAAAQTGHTKTVRFLLDQGVNIEERDQDHFETGDTALMEAADNGHSETVVYLLDRRANIEAKNARGDTTLINAASDGRTEVVKLLLSRGAKVDDKDNAGHTALFYARSQHRNQITQILETAGEKD